MPRIDELYAWVAIDEGGANDEGIAAHLGPNGWVPLVGADLERIEQLRPIAMMVATKLRRPVRLVRFSTRTVLEEHAPAPEKGPVA